MSRLKRLGFLAAFFSCSFALHVEAQESDYVLQSHVRLVTADVTVYDKKTKQSITNLTLSDFKLYDNDREQPILNFSAPSKDEHPVAIVLLLNLWFGYDSLSRETIPNAVASAFARMRPLDRVAVVTWGIPSPGCTPEMQVAQDFTNDSTRLKEVLETLVTINERPVKRTQGVCNFRHDAESRRLVDTSYLKGQEAAVGMAAQKLSQLPSYRRKIVALANDYILSDSSTMTTMLKQLYTDNVEMNAIKDPNFMVALASLLVAKSTKGELANLAEETGGLSISPSKSDYAAVLEQLLLGSASQYSISWKPSEVDGAFHKIRVEVKNQSLRTRTRKGYFVPEASAQVH